MTIILSKYQAEILLAARKNNLGMVSCSPDLGITFVEAAISEEGCLFPEELVLDWRTIEKIKNSESSCFVWDSGQLSKINRYSDLTNRVYSLMPTQSSPTMLISGIPMHRIKGTDPQKDTQQKIKSIQPISGTVLDTATGLGYTAIQASRNAHRVITVEFDPSVLDICRMNPWSRELFDNPVIEQRIGDVFEEIHSIGDQSINMIIHDPPVFALAGHLYSEEFYFQLFRVLKVNGRVFHYIGNPESKSGRTTTSGVKERMQDSGFIKIKDHKNAFGVTATRP